MKTPHGRAAVKDEPAAYATEAILGRRSLRMRPESEDLHGTGFATRTGTEKRPRTLHGSGAFFIYKFTAVCMEGCNISAQNNALRG